MDDTLSTPSCFLQMEHVGDFPPSESSSRSSEVKVLAETPEENIVVINPPNYQSSMEDPTISNNSREESGTHLAVTEFAESAMLKNDSGGENAIHDEHLSLDDSPSASKFHGTEESQQGAVVVNSESGTSEDVLNRQKDDGASTVTASNDVEIDNVMKLSTSSNETRELQNEPEELITEPPQTVVTDVRIDDSVSTSNATVLVTEQSHQGDVMANPDALEEFSNKQQDGDSTVITTSRDVDDQIKPLTSSLVENELLNDRKEQEIDPSQIKISDVAVGYVDSPIAIGNDVDNVIKLSASSSEKNELQNDHRERKIDPPQTKVADVAVGDVIGNDVDEIKPLASSKEGELENDHIEQKIDPSQTKITNVDVGDVVDSPTGSDVDNQIKLLASSSSEKVELQNENERVEIDQPQTKVSEVAVDTPTKVKQIAARRGLIDTAAPFESVKEAVSKFGGIVDWKAHKTQTVERRKHVEVEYEKAHKEIPEYRKKSVAAEQAKLQVLQELDSTRRLVEELKLNLERAQTEERQARQDSELAKLRVEEMEQGIADDSSVAAKAQLEVAKARYTAAITELASVKVELDALRKEYASLVVEKEEAMKKAEEAVASSKQVEKTVEELTIDLIATKESLETAHAAHLEAEEHRIGTVMARDQDSLNWEKELKQAEEELGRLNKKILAAKDLKSKLNTASTLLLDLKTELNAYMESKSNHEGGKEGVLKGVLEEPEKKTHNEIQEAVASAKKELDEVKLNTEKATTTVSYLKVAAASLKSELERERANLASIRQREGMASVTVASLEAELGNAISETVLVQTKEKEGRERIVELPKKLQKAAEEANHADLLAQAACEELRRVKEEAEQAKAGASTMQSRLLAAQKEIEAAKASERLAMAAIKALQESELAVNKNQVDSSTGVTLSVEEYFHLSKQAHDAEKQANLRVAAANAEIDTAKESELKTLEKLKEVNREMTARRESLKIAMAKAEKAREGKLGAEQDLRKWRAEHEQQRKKAGELGQVEVHQNRSSKVSFERQKEANNFGHSHSGPIPVHYLSNPRTYVHSSSGTLSPPDTKNGKKKKKSFFPRILMFFTRKKAHPTHSG
ncbi:hypothetical protein RJT34_08075 [Clitoria ternatea]|uniref:Uncharacterized protein n=1 Tax=Clitoria ternatea TaxID=43366 RepID=A0AAN9PTW5_CLITE